MRWGFFVLLLFSIHANATTDIVPVGVRAVVYQHINAEVKGSYGPNGIPKSYDVEEKLKIDLISKAQPKAEAAIKRLRETDKDLVNNLDLGSIDMKPDIRLDVDVFGMAFGVSKDFMIVGVVPVYNARTHVGGSGFNTTESFQKSAKVLRARIADKPEKKTEYNAIADFLSDMSPPNGQNAQAILTNEFGYKPLGNWSGQGIGDLMLFGQYRSLDAAVYKQAWKAGAEVPTGRTDDPDNLIDVPFGKGHFVSFVEFLNDYYVLHDNWILATNFKFAYNWGHTPVMRLVPDDEIPLTKDKEQVYRKPGNISQINLHSEVKIVSDLSFHTDYFYMRKGRDQVHGARQDYDYGILEKNTDQITHTAEAGLSFTTVGLYSRGRFPLPFKAGVFYNRIIGGVNIDRVDMTIFRMEAYF